MFTVQRGEQEQRDELKQNFNGDFCFNVILLIFLKSNVVFYYKLNKMLKTRFICKKIYSFVSIHPCIPFHPVCRYLLFRSKPKSHTILHFSVIEHQCQDVLLTQLLAWRFSIQPEHYIPVPCQFSMNPSLCHVMLCWPVALFNQIIIQLHIDHVMFWLASTF